MKWKKENKDVIRANDDITYILDLIYQKTFNTNSDFGILLLFFIFFLLNPIVKCHILPLYDKVIKYHNNKILISLYAYACCFS